jgi:hypothetical protein
MPINPENMIAIFAWLGISCFCGLVPLGFAALLFFTSRKRSQVGSVVSSARQTTVAALRPGLGLVRLQGVIAPHSNAIDGDPAKALVYLRLKVEEYKSYDDSSGWAGLTDKIRCIPFQLTDATGSVWVNPDGLDKQLLGDGIVPTSEQIEAACILLGIPQNILRGQLRFTLWELRAGQTVSVIGAPSQAQNGMEIAKLQGLPMIVSPLLGQAVVGNISSQAKKAQVWTFLLGIPGLLFLLCGLIGALVSLINLLRSQ